MNRLQAVSQYQESEWEPELSPRKQSGEVLAAPAKAGVERKAANMRSAMTHAVAPPVPTTVECSQLEVGASVGTA